MSQMIDECMWISFAAHTKREEPVIRLEMIQTDKQL